jgi:hypothetical protein
MHVCRAYANKLQAKGKKWPELDGLKAEGKREKMEKRLAWSSVEQYTISRSQLRGHLN